MTAELTIEKVEVVNLQGQVIKSFSNQETYDISDLSFGMYMLIINSDNATPNSTQYGNNITIFDPST